MSVCSCDYSDCIGMRIGGPFTARKPGYDCAICSAPVSRGSPCVDAAGLSEDGSGFFYRFHALCWEIGQRFKVEVCGLEWGEMVPGRFDLEEASAHALAAGDEPFWKDWLLIYEMTWAYAAPLKKPYRRLTCEDCIAFSRCLKKGHGPTRYPPKIHRFADTCHEFTELQGGDS